MSSISFIGLKAKVVAVIAPLLEVAAENAEFGSKKTNIFKTAVVCTRTFISANCQKSEKTQN